MKERRTKSGLRGVTRFYAVQKLYQFELLNKPISDIAASVSISDEITIAEDISISGIDLVFLKTLLNALSDNLANIDDVISKHMSDKWTLDRLDPVIKSILRLGVTELLYLEDVPANVIFNEYIEIAKSFFAKDDVSFVNGLLNAVSKSHPIKPESRVEEK